jgi:hypothetical protein
MKIKAQVEFDDDGASMAGAYGGSIRRSEVITFECPSKEAFNQCLQDMFKSNRPYSTIRRVDFINESGENNCHYETTTGSVCNKCGKIH